MVQRSAMFVAETVHVAAIHCAVQVRVMIKPARVHAFAPSHHLHLRTPTDVILRGRVRSAPRAVNVLAMNADAFAGGR